MTDHLAYIEAIKGAAEMIRAEADRIWERRVARWKRAAKQWYPTLEAEARLERLLEAMEAEDRKHETPK